MDAKTDHYFSKKPKSRFIPHEFTYRLLGRELTFHTSSGVFSIRRIDKGTEVLIENCIVEDNTDVLDLCSGYGPVGIALAKGYPDMNITMSELNERAVRLARQNIKANCIPEGRIAVLKADLYKKVKDKRFDTIIVNPPHTAGKEICLDIIRQAPEHLKPGGTLQLVARHNKGGKSLAEEMKSVFNNVKIIAKKAGYRVYLSTLTTL